MLESPYSSTYIDGTWEEIWDEQGDFAVDGTLAGENLAARFQSKGDGVWELRLAKPISQLPQGLLTVSIQDREGNINRIERKFAVTAGP